MKNMTTTSDGPALQQRKKLSVVKNEAKGLCKWIVCVSFLAVGIGLVCVSVNFGNTSSTSGGNGKNLLHSLYEEFGYEVPFAGGGTTFHITEVGSNTRWKRASVGIVDNRQSSGSASGSSGSGSEQTTTPAVESSGSTTDVSELEDTTTAAADGSNLATAPATDASGEEVTTNSMFESSGETTAPLELSGDTTTSSLESSEDTTTAPLEPSGDTTTASMESSGDTTTQALEMSGDVTTDSSVVTTESMFESSGETTAATATEEASGEASGTTTPTTTEEEKTTAVDQETTAEQTTTSTTEQTTVAETTTFEATTAAEDDESGELLIPLYIAIIIGLVCIILGAVCAVAVMKCLQKRKAITPMPSTVTLVDGDIAPPPEPNWLMAREDTLRKAMALGQISVLEFALSESIAAGLVNEIPKLMKEAESKLNVWKRTRTQLETAYRERDLVSMDEFMTRFQEYEMKDDTGIYQRCVDLKWNMKYAELNMENAAESRNEAMLISSMGQYESLKLPEPVMAANIPYQNARRVAEEIRQEKQLQGRTFDVYRMDIRAAVLSRDSVAITVAIDKFVAAEIPDVFDDVANANKALETIEAQRKDNLDVAQTKLEEASFLRDQEALRQAIEECKQHGATEEDLKPSEKLLRIIEREDALLSEMRDLTLEEDMTKLANAIAIFKTPTLEMVDKTGDFAKAEQTLEKLQQKEKMRRTKEDVYWRIQNAMAIGDPMALDGMIKALQGLAAAGEEIDEALLLRAVAELEACRGQVDYRKRMEAIKSAIGRIMALENIPQLQDLIDQMSLLAEDQEYTMTADDSRVLDESRTALNTIQTKKAVVDEITLVRPGLTLALIPPNLPQLNESVDRMSAAKVAAQPFEGVFTAEDSVLLEEAKVNAKVLDHKVGVMNAARERLDLAVDGREYTELKRSIRNAIDAPFIERKELIEPRKLAVFLDPKARRMAVKRAMRTRDIRGLEIALQDFKDAKVDDEVLQLKGERTLEKLKKRERRKAKEERKKEREDARRTAEIARLTGVLQSAIASRDTEHLQLALEEFEESGYDDEDVPNVTEAEELFDTLKIQDLRERLMDSIHRRDLTGLENAIDDADYGGYVMDVKEEYDIAKDLLYHLRELNSLREAISEMNRSLISEIHKYPTPPPAVHTVMSAVFILLGESPKKLQNWNEVQALLGKLGPNSITRRVRLCVPGDIPSAAVAKSEHKLTELQGLKLSELSDISKGAATFYAWTTCLIKEHSQVSKEQIALADLGLPDIGLPDRPVTRGGDYAWVEENA